MHGPDKVIFYGIGVGTGGAMCPPNHLTGQRAQVQDMAHHTGIVSTDSYFSKGTGLVNIILLWNFLNKQLKSVLCLTYCSFYSQETSCLHCHTGSSMQSGHGLNEMWAWSKIRVHVLFGPPNLKYLPTPMYGTWYVAKPMGKMQPEDIYI